MNKIAILFAGQGSQYKGMGVSLYTAIPTVPAIFECGSDILGFDLKEVCSNYEPDALSQTAVAQPAIFAVSLAAFEGVKAADILPQAVAGHSLGEYAALVASGMVSLETGFKLIKARAAAMGACTSNQNGAMAAIIGLSAAEIASECESIEGYVIPVNFNSPTQTVIAGEADAVSIAMERFTAMGKKAIKLSVSAAFHSALMQQAADEFYNAIKDVAFNAPNIEIYSNISGKVLTDFTDMPTYLRNHMISPVQFVDILKGMESNGISRFIECGPGKVLSGLVRKTIKNVTIQNVEDERSLQCLKQS